MQLAALQGSEVTYTLDPSNKAVYSTFCESFDLESRTAEIEQLFKTQPAMEAIHHRLVPEKVAYRVFWSNYLRERGIFGLRRFCGVNIFRNRSS